MLIKCNECGKEISDKATSCPNCGAPVKIEKNAEEIEKEIAEKFVYDKIGITKLNELITQNNVSINNVMNKVRKIKKNPDPKKLKTNSENNSNILAIIIGIIVLAVGVYFMINGTSKILGGNNKVQYNEKDDTYTVELYRSYDY